MDFLTNPNIIFYLVAYLAGGIPFGLLLAKQFAGVNIKESGSKSIGATNVLRVVKEQNPALAKKLSIATVALDATKGAIIILIAMALGMSTETLWAIGVLSVLGHCYSVFLNFEGGKGVATALGAFIILIPIPTIIGAIAWFFCAKVLKISSLSSLVGLIGVIVGVLLLNDGLGIDSNAPLYFITFIIIYKHIPNIIRLFQGKELKVA